MAQPGYVYVLTNPSTNGMVKIGKTGQKPDERAKALSSAPGVPAPFVVVYHAYFEDCNEAEAYVHGILEPFRFSINREFFQIAIPMAIDTIIQARNHFGWVQADSNILNGGSMNIYDQADIFAFEPIRDNEKGIYELLDVFMNCSMRGWKRFVKTMGLSMPQFSILMQLHYNGVYSISEVSDLFGISVPAASQLVDKLVQTGYLDRSEDPNDRRSRILALSQKGKDLIEQGFRGRYRWMDQIITALSPKDREKVAEGLVILTESARKLEQTQ